MGKLRIDDEIHYRANIQGTTPNKGTIDVTWNGNKFRGVKVKYPHRCFHCYEHSYNDCSYYSCSGMSCPAMVKRRTRIFSLITGFILSAITFYVLYFMHINLFVKFGIIIASCIILDIIARFICGLDIHEKRMEKKIIKKLKKMLKDKDKGKINDSQTVITEAEIKQEETLKAKIEQAEGFIKELNHFKAYISGNSELENCIFRFEAIMKLIKENKVRYYNAAELFEEYLPRICNMLGYYTDFLDCGNNELAVQKNEVISNLIHMFNNSLTDAKINSMFSIESSEKQFDTIANELTSLLSKSQNTENNVEGNDNNEQG